MSNYKLNLSNGFSLAFTMWLFKERSLVIVKLLRNVCEIASSAHFGP